MCAHTYLTIKQRISVCLCLSFTYLKSSDLFHSWQVHCWRGRKCSIEFSAISKHNTFSIDKLWINKWKAPLAVALQSVKCILRIYFLHVSNRSLGMFLFLPYKTNIVTNRQIPLLMKSMLYLKTAMVRTESSMLSAAGLYKLTVHFCCWMLDILMLWPNSSSLSWSQWVDRNSATL